MPKRSPLSTARRSLFRLGIPSYPPFVAAFLRGDDLSFWRRKTINLVSSSSVRYSPPGFIPNEVLVAFVCSNPSLHMRPLPPAHAEYRISPDGVHCGCWRAFCSAGTFSSSMCHYHSFMHQ